MKTITTTYWAVIALLLLTAGSFAFSVQKADQAPYWYAEATADHPSDTISVLPPGGTGPFELSEVCVNGRVIPPNQYTVQTNKGGIWIKLVRPLEIGDEVAANGSGPVSGKGVINIA